MQKCKFAVSIGGDCVPKEQIEKHRMPTISGPFDRTITSTSALLFWLEQDFKNFMEELDLEHRYSYYYPTDPYFKTVYCMRSGMVFPHDFKDNTKRLNKDVKSKYIHKINSFRKLMQTTEKVLFIKKWSTKEDANKLTKQLEKTRNGLSWHLLIYTEDKEKWYMDNVTNVHIPYVDADYPGNYEKLGKPLKELMECSFSNFL